MSLNNNHAADVTAYARKMFFEATSKASIPKTTEESISYKLDLLLEKIENMEGHFGIGRSPIITGPEVIKQLKKLTGVDVEIK